MVGTFLWMKGWCARFLYRVDEEDVDLNCCTCTIVGVEVYEEEARLSVKPSYWEEVTTIVADYRKSLGSSRLLPRDSVSNYRVSPLEQMAMELEYGCGNSPD